MIVDEWQQEIRLNYIEDMLTLAYARCMAEEIPDLVKKKCYGCNLIDIQTGELYDHPSQQHHNVCLMMDLEQKVELCFNDALDKIDDTEELYLTWFEELGKMDPPAGYMEYTKYCCQDWRRLNWMTSTWRDEVTEIICQNL